ncbi:MAG: hypothetical protein ABFD60_11160 [Bryobacteraceae bacterium]
MSGPKTEIQELREDLKGIRRRVELLTLAVFGLAVLILREDLLGNTVKALVASVLP